jgi:predicted nucleotidyltransferase
MVSLAKEYGATRLILFGSTLDHPETARDLDLACDIKGWNLFVFAGRIESEFMISVDIVDLSTPTYLTNEIERLGRILL